MLRIGVSTKEDVSRAMLLWLLNFSTVVAKGPGFQVPTSRCFIGISMAILVDIQVKTLDFTWLELPGIPH
jgi:hypothetical protein